MKNELGNKVQRSIESTLTVHVLSEIRNVNDCSYSSALITTHRYFRLRITWTSPLLLPSTFLPLVVSNPQKPIVFIISTSSAVFPSKSASDTRTRLEILDFDDDGCGERERCLLVRSKERDLLRDLIIIWEVESIAHLGVVNIESKS